MYALNDFIKPIIEIIPHMISRPIINHKKYDKETEDDVIAQVVYLYHHFKEITSESSKSCHVDLPCEGNDFGFSCLDGQIRAKGLSSFQSSLKSSADAYRRDVSNEIRKLEGSEYIYTSSTSSRDKCETSRMMEDLFRMAKQTNPNDGSISYGDCVKVLEILSDKDMSHVKKFKDILFEFEPEKAAQC